MQQFKRKRRKRQNSNKDFALHSSSRDPYPDQGTRTLVAPTDVQKHQRIIRAIVYVTIYLDT